MSRTTRPGRGNTTRFMMVRILFYGDPHGNWKPLLKACADDQPDGVVILGDCDLVRPLSAEVAPLLKAGIPLYWIAGNHDSDREEWFANLFQGGRSEERRVGNGWRAGVW